MKIKADLSVKGIESVKRQLLQYKDNLPIKCEKLVSRLLQSGVSVSQTKINESPLGKYVTITTDIQPEKAGCKAMLIATGVTKSTDYGDVNMLLLIEFGAGIHHNPVANPKADEFGFGVGTFPNQKHAFEDGWWYPGDDGEWHYTHGTKATMPMYNASTEMLLNIRKIAKEVFRS